MKKRNLNGQLFLPSLLKKTAKNGFNLLILWDYLILYLGIKNQK
jgi:hypothetical protein